MIEIILPPLGEGIEKATVSFWYHREGEQVQENEDLVELTTDKATFNLPAPCAGTLIKIICQEGRSVKIGEILCIIEENA